MWTTIIAVLALTALWAAIVRWIAHKRDEELREALTALRSSLAAEDKTLTGLLQSASEWAARLERAAGEMGRRGGSSAAPTTSHDRDVRAEPASESWRPLKEIVFTFRRSSEDEGAIRRFVVRAFARKVSYWPWAHTAVQWEEARSKFSGPTILGPISGPFRQDVEETFRVPTAHRHEGFRIPTNFWYSEPRSLNAPWHYACFGHVGGLEEWQVMVGQEVRDHFMLGATKASRRHPASYLNPRLVDPKMIPV